MAHLGDAVVILLGGDVDAAVLGPHGAEFVHLEHPAAVGGALLAVEHRAAVLQADGQGRCQQDGGGQHQAHHGHQDIPQTLDDALLEPQFTDGQYIMVLSSNMTRSPAMATTSDISRL